MIDLLKVVLIGPTSQGEKEAAAARANHHIPPACGIYYYEVTIIDKGFKGYVYLLYDKYPSLTIPGP